MVAGADGKGPPDDTPPPTAAAVRAAAGTGSGGAAVATAHAGGTQVLVLPDHLPDLRPRHPVRTDTRERNRGPTRPPAGPDRAVLGRGERWAVLVLANTAVALSLFMVVTLASGWWKTC
ncbi:hypothetical protein GCM10027521_08820 [Amycolatopsis cihanbeyliensis]